MKREAALDDATRIGNLIKQGEQKLLDTAPKDLPLLARIPLFVFSEGIENSRVIDPTICEILLFGSVANESIKNVNDIDLMMLDRGFYSTFFLKKVESEGRISSSGSPVLRNNLEELLIGWFGFRREMPHVDMAIRSDIDLHVMKIDVLWSTQKREAVADHHVDPNFFENALSRIMRFDGTEFVPTTLQDLQTRHTHIHHYA